MQLNVIAFKNIMVPNYVPLISKAEIYTEGRHFELDGQYVNNGSGGVLLSLLHRKAQGPQR